MRLVNGRGLDFSACVERLVFVGVVVDNGGRK